MRLALERAGFSFPAATPRAAPGAVTSTSATRYGLAASLGKGYSLACKLLIMGFIKLGIDTKMNRMLIGTSIGIVFCLAGFAGDRFSADASEAARNADAAFARARKLAQEGLVLKARGDHYDGAIKYLAAADCLRGILDLGLVPGDRTGGYRQYMDLYLDEGIALCVRDMRATMKVESAQVDGIKDGDTVYTKQGRQERHIRYLCVDTPEKNAPLYEEATEANRRLVERRWVTLCVNPQEPLDHYGRSLAFVLCRELSGRERLVNAELVRNGLAKRISPSRFTERYKKLFEVCESIARMDNLGIWKR